MLRNVFLCVNFTGRMKPRVTSCFYWPQSSRAHFFPFVTFMKPGVEPFMEVCQAYVHETGISCSITGFHFNKLAPNYPSVIVQGLTDGIGLSTRPTY